MNIIAEYSDYAIQSVQFFIDEIENNLGKRDIPGLTNDKIQLINVTKEHPLVALMASQINPNPKSQDALRSSILPAIAVTPGNMSEEGISFALSPHTSIANDEFIEELKELFDVSQKEIQKNKGLITIEQIENIIAAYKKSNGILRIVRNGWGWNEELNISCWSESPDLDILLSTLMDSTLARIRVGFMGDESPVKNLKYRVTRGLTNFNFGRVLFGTEYNLTFFNTYHNYTVYQEDYVTGHDLNGTFKTPGSDEEWQMPTE